MTDIMRILNYADVQVGVLVAASSSRKELMVIVLNNLGLTNYLSLLVLRMLSLTR